jgi:hypothetical protein
LTLSVLFVRLDLLDEEDCARYGIGGVTIGILVGSFGAASLLVGLVRGFFVFSPNFVFPALFCGPVVYFLYRFVL